MIPSWVYNIYYCSFVKGYKRRCVHTLVGYPHREGTGVRIESELCMVNVSHMHSSVHCVFVMPKNNSETTFVSRVTWMLKVKGSQVTLFFIQPSNYYLGFQSLLLSLVILCFHGTVTSCDPIFCQNRMVTWIF